MRVFPIACALFTLIFYLAAYKVLNDPRHPASTPLEAVSPSGSQAARLPVQQHGRDVSSVPSSSVVSSVVMREALAPTLTVESEKQLQQTHSMVKSAPTPVAEHRLALVLDGTVEAALRYAVPAGRPKFVLVTFGNLGVKDQLLNFVSHATRAGAMHVVGAVDVGAFDLMVAHGTAAYKTPLASESYSMDGSNQHSSGSWKKFAGMRTGEVAKIVLLGYTVMHTDCDVVWLRDPMPYLMCDEAAAASAEWGSGCAQRVHAYDAHACACAHLMPSGLRVRPIWRSLQAV